VLADLVDRLQPLKATPLPLTAPDSFTLDRAKLEALLPNVPTRQRQLDVLLACYGHPHDRPLRLYEVAEQLGERYVRVCTARRDGLHHLYTSHRRQVIERGLVTHPSHPLWVAMYKEFGWLHREEGATPQAAWQWLTRKIDLEAGKALATASLATTTTRA
jgi:hypothetical protein